jgi:hypothetical protein
LGGDSLVRWFLPLCLPARRPLGPRTSVVIRELVDELAAVEEWATRKPLGMRTRLAVAWVSSFLRFDMRGGWTRVHQDCEKIEKNEA